MGIREPPSSIDAEMACLGSVLIRPSALDELSDLQIDDFSIPAHREILDVMRAIVSRGRALDFVGIADELRARGMLLRLKNGEQYLLELTKETPTSENVRFYAKTVAEKAALRRLIAACSEIASGSYSDVPDVGDYLAEARAKISAVELAGDKGPSRFTELVDGVIDDMEKRAANPDSYFIRTGLRRLDSLITGMEPGTVTIVAANPSRGKTALAINTLQRVGLVGIPGIAFSLEMKDQKIVERALAFQARINGRAIQRGELTLDEWNRIGNVQRNWHSRNLPIWIDDRVMTAARICSVARRWRTRVRADRLAAGMAEKEADLALVVIDYLGMVKADGEGESRRLEVAAMSAAFKELAKNENLAVMLCAQLNRANMKDAAKPRPPILSDLRDAGEIEQDGDIILFPWWEGEPPMEGAHPAEIICRKNRNGPTGHAKVLWERDMMTFSDLTGDDDDE